MGPICEVKSHKGVVRLPSTDPGEKAGPGTRALTTTAAIILVVRKGSGVMFIYLLINSLLAYRFGCWEHSQASGRSQVSRGAGPGDWGLCGGREKLAGRGTGPGGIKKQRGLPGGGVLDLGAEE